MEGKGRKIIERDDKLFPKQNMAGSIRSREWDPLENVEEASSDLHTTLRTLRL